MPREFCLPVNSVEPGRLLTFPGGGGRVWKDGLLWEPKWTRPGQPAHVSLVPDHPQPGGEQLSCLEKLSFAVSASSEKKKKKKTFLFQVGREKSL